jgi:thioredoxin reductase (NADPH)
MTFFSTSERLEIGDVPFVSNNAKPTRAEALEYYRRVAVHRKLAINLFETVESVTHKKTCIKSLQVRHSIHAKASLLLQAFMIFLI